MCRQAAEELPQNAGVRWTAGVLVVPGPVRVVGLRPVRPVRPWRVALLFLLIAGSALLVALAQMATGPVVPATRGASGSRAE